LANTPGFRFAAIHSNHPDDIVDRLRAEFPGSFTNFKPENANQEEAGDLVHREGEGREAQSDNDVPSTYRIGQNLYVCVIQKRGADLSSAAQLPDLFYSHLRRVFSDHLHWIGFDFAARIRELLPVILDSLPASNDVGLVFQALVQGDNELAKDVIDCMCQEIRALMNDSPPQAALDDVILGKLVERMRSKGQNEQWKTACTKDLKDACAVITGGKINGKFTKFFGIKPESSASESKAQVAQKIVSRFISGALNLNDPENTHSIGHDGYAALREQIQCYRPNRLFPGVILRNDGTNTSLDEWLLCISPACDCARSSGPQEFLFVGGNSMKSPAAESASALQTCLYSKPDYIHVNWSSKRFRTQKCSPDMVDGYVFHSSLRDEYTYLLIQRVMGWQSRFGVNTSEFLRIQRQG
jgi:hypothetical protein